MSSCLIIRAYPVPLIAPDTLLAQAQAFRAIFLCKELGGRAARIPEGGCAEQPLIW